MKTIDEIFNEKLKEFDELLEGGREKIQLAKIEARKKKEDMESLAGEKNGKQPKTKKV